MQGAEIIQKRRDEKEKAINEINDGIAESESEIVKWISVASHLRWTRTFD